MLKVGIGEKLSLDKLKIVFVEKIKCGLVEVREGVNLKKKCFLLFLFYF